MWIIVVVAILSAPVAVVIWRMYRVRLRRNLVGIKTWGFYVKGQGLILSIFLILGWFAAWGSTKIGPAHGREVGQIRLIEFDSLNASERPFREVDTKKYLRMTVFTKTVEPQNGVATVTMYSDRDGVSGKSEVRRLASVADSWTRWDQPVSGQHVSFIVAPSTELNASTASHVRIMVYLSSQ
jgi:hypothetical protein